MEEKQLKIKEIIKNIEKPINVRNTDDVYSQFRDSIVNQEIEKAIKAIKYFGENNDIGERELRKIMNQHLSGVTH